MTTGSRIDTIDYITKEPIVAEEGWEAVKTLRQFMSGIYRLIQLLRNYIKSLVILDRMKSNA